jgi:hypothetical protein
MSHIDEHGDVWIEINVDDAPKGLLSKMQSLLMLRHHQVPSTIPTQPNIYMTILEMNLTAYISMLREEGNSR